MNQVALVPDSKPAVPAAVTPMQMLQIAVQQGADLDKLQKLMDLQERWEKNEARKAFVAALVAFKANPPELHKNKLVSFDTSKGKTEYKHATLDEVSVNIGKALSDYGLSHRWDVEQKDGVIKVTCILTHSIGHSESVPMEGVADQSGGKNSIQAIGSTVTYLQRYTLLAATGMAVRDHDDDGAGAERVGMPGAMLADFETEIEALKDAGSAEALWKRIVSCCKEMDDREAYDSLKAKMIAKGKALRGEK